jgi:hypothetical protein
VKSQEIAAVELKRLRGAACRLLLRCGRGMDDHRWSPDTPLVAV